MAETQRTITAMQTILANNTSGAISPTDVRDLMETLRHGHGEISVTSSAATTPDDTDAYKTMAGTYALSADVHNWDMNTNGQLRYTGAAQRTCHVAMSVSFLSASNNQVVHFRIGKNGTSIAQSETVRKLSTGADIGSTALHAFTTVVTNDYLTLMVRNESSTATVTASFLNMFAMDMSH